MGRRSINTTKSGKYMNPTDQARKEARKKELKKNKRQRQMVRAAVLKNKDPAQILEEMEKIDEMEYNCLQPSPLNEKVLRDKRKKLRETFDRVMRLYHTDEPDLWAELKRKEVEYEKKRLKKQQYYESVKHAQSVQIDDIPLPTATQGQIPATIAATDGCSDSGVSFPPPLNRLQPPLPLGSLPATGTCPPALSIKVTAEKQHFADDIQQQQKKKQEPNVPAGPPPNFFTMAELDTDAEDEDSADFDEQLHLVMLKEYNRKVNKTMKNNNSTVSLAKPNPLQQRMLAISGQTDIDEFMREMENVHQKKAKEREAAAAAAVSTSDGRYATIISDDKSGAIGVVKTVKDNTNCRKKSIDTDINYDEVVSHTNSSENESDSDINSVKKHSKESITIPLPPTTTMTPNKNLSITATVATSLTPPQPSSSSAAHLPMPAPSTITSTAIAPPPSHSLIFRPPPLRPLPPSGVGGGLSNFMPRPPMMPPVRMGIRMPPGPPPGLPPPRMVHHHKMQHQLQQQQLQSQQLIHKDKGITTITAKPQIRNLSADVTRFVPSTLRVKRDDTRKLQYNRNKMFVESMKSSATAAVVPVEIGGISSKSATKDDAYMQFMNEMQGLL